MKDEKLTEVVYERGDPENGRFGIRVETDSNTARLIRKNKILIQLFGIGIVAGIAYLIYLAL